MTLHGTTDERTSSFKAFKVIAVAGALLALALPAMASAGGCGTVVSEQLAGPAWGGPVSGQAIADESQLLCGGTTSLLVEVSNVDLPDGTVLDVWLDFTPIGSITLGGTRGALTTDLGRFAVSKDSVRVSFQGTLVAVGSFFR